MEIVSMEFGDRLKELREAAGLSQEALARAASVSTSSVSKLEQKKVDPTWGMVQSLCKALGVRCEAFEMTDAPPAADEPAAKKRGRGKK
jgi:transcriptional regulator with XRE-family HTH domain